MLKNKLTEIKPQIYHIQITENQRRRNCLRQPEKTTIFYTERENKQTNYGRSLARLCKLEGDGEASLECWKEKHVNIKFDTQKKKYFKNKGDPEILQLGLYTRELKTAIQTNPMYV